MWKVSLVVKDFLITVAERKKYHTSLFFFTLLFSPVSLSRRAGNVLRGKCVVRRGRTQTDILPRGSVARNSHLTPAMLRAVIQPAKHIHHWFIPTKSYSPKGLYATIR